MARPGRGFPNRPVVLRSPLPYVNLYAGAAPTSFEATGSLSISRPYAGMAPFSTSASAGLLRVIKFTGPANTAMSAAGIIYWLVPSDIELAAEAAVAGSTTILRRLDIYEADGVTPFLEDVGVISGNITVSDGSDTRRTCTFTLYNEDGALIPSTDGFWFDKIVKAYRGYRLTSRDDQEVFFQVGEFVVSPINSTSFPVDQIDISGSDYSYVLKLATFSTVTTFSAGQTVEDVVTQIAEYGGISKFATSRTDRVLTADWPIETTDNLWSAIQAICADHGCEAFFSPDGYLVVRVVTEPSLRPSMFTFATGESGSVVDLSKAISSEGLYNHVVVRGETSDVNVEPVWVSVENNEPSSPTHIYDPDAPELGGIARHTYHYTSPLITTEEQATEVANALLVQLAILDIDATLNALVVPWIDVGTVVTVHDPNPSEFETEVERWVVKSFSIPWSLGPVSYTLARAIKVG